MWCWRCGKENPQGARFCGFCGAPLIVPVARKSPWRLWVAAGIVAILGVALVLTLVWRGRAAPRSLTAMPTKSATPFITPAVIPIPTAVPTFTITPIPTPTLTPLPRPTHDATAPIPQVTPTPTSTVSPTPQPLNPLPNCPSPNARITYPRLDDWISGVVKIVGSADIPNFQYYKIEYRPSGETNWRFLVRFDRQVTNGTLMEWHTYTVPSGRYELRLTVVDRSGNYPEPCIARMRIY